MSASAFSHLLSIVASLPGGTGWCSARSVFDRLSSQNSTRVRGNIQKQRRLSSGVAVYQAEVALKSGWFSYDSLSCRCRSISPRGARKVLHQNLKERSHRSSNFKDLLRRLAGMHQHNLVCADQFPNLAGTHQRVRGCINLAPCSQTRSTALQLHCRY